MSTLLDSDVGTESIILLDFEAYLACEGGHHTQGISGHDPEQQGAFLLVAPCCGPKVIQCTARVQYLKEKGLIYCTNCETENLVENYLFIPVGES